MSEIPLPPSVEIRPVAREDLAGLARFIQPFVDEGKLLPRTTEELEELVYNGFWFSPEREMIQAAVDESQKHVSGTVRLKLFKGLVTVVGRKSPVSLYSEQHVTFEADTVYDQRDAEGFIKLNALRLRLMNARKG